MLLCNTIGIIYSTFISQFGNIEKLISFFVKRKLKVLAVDRLHPRSNFT